MMVETFLAFIVAGLGFAIGIEVVGAIVASIQNFIHKLKINKLIKEFAKKAETASEKVKTFTDKVDDLLDEVKEDKSKTKTPKSTPNKTKKTNKKTDKTETK